MKIRFYMDKDNNVFTSEDIKNGCEDFYWGDICDNFLKEYCGDEIIGQLFFDGCYMYKDDFKEYVEEYIKGKKIKENYAEIILDIPNEDIVE